MSSLLCGSASARASGQVSSNEANQVEEIPEAVEIDDDLDSAYGEGLYSDTTSLTSSIARGIVQNGRRYQTMREGEYWGPADDKQFESMNLTHLTYLVLDNERENPYFRSPVGKNIQNILDVGCGDASWAFDVADRYPSATVRGIDLAPPPHTFLPPNLHLEIDDVLKPWTFSAPFSLIHVRWLLGSFPSRAWKGFYKQAYNNLEPGGWFEQVEPGSCFKSDDGTLPQDSKLGRWQEDNNRLAEKTGRPVDILPTMRRKIEEAGFVNVREQDYKIPIGTWPKNNVMKEAGRLNLKQIDIGMEGMLMFSLTTFGGPLPDGTTSAPWSKEQADIFIAQVKEELHNKKWHCYTISKRVWAQKPLDAGQV